MIARDYESDSFCPFKTIGFVAMDEWISRVDTWIQITLDDWIDTVV